MFKTECIAFINAIRNYVRLNTQAYVICGIKPAGIRTSFNEQTNAQ